MEPWQTFVVQGGALAALTIFMRAQSQRQDRLFNWFMAKLNGNLERLCEATDANTEATEELGNKIDESLQQRG